MTENEQKLNAILDRALDAIVATDTDGNITIFNGAAASMFQYTNAEVIGKNVKILMPEEFSKEHDYYIQNYRENSTSKIIGSGRETLARKKDGTIFPIWIGVNTIGKDSKMGFTGVIRDLTFEKDMVEKLQQSYESAQQANISKSKFLSAMNHQLRTPLNSIIGFSQLLAEDKLNPLNEDQLESINFINEAGNHLLKIVNEIIDISRIDSGELTFNINPIDLRRVIEDCISFTHEFSVSRKIELINASNTSKKIQGDIARVRQVLLHLITNAIKYSYAGGKVSIQTQVLDSHPNMIRICVIDHGNGIPEAKQNRIFSPFNIDKGEETKGFGLGLALSKKLVEGMNGKIGFKSKENEGSQFWFDLPII